MFRASPGVRRGGKRRRLAGSGVRGDVRVGAWSGFDAAALGALSDEEEDC